MEANHSLPFRIMPGMLANVSTLLMSVGLGPQAALGRVWRPGDRLPAAAFDGSEQRGLLAANVGSGANAHVDAEVETAFENAVAQQTFAARLLDGRLEPRDGKRRFAAHIDVSLVCANSASGNRHAFENKVRIAFQNRCGS